jgi:hypothetical protein
LTSRFGDQGDDAIFAAAWEWWNQVRKSMAENSH